MIALNIIFAIIVFAGVVGSLAFAIVKSRPAAAAKVSTAPVPATTIAKRRPAARRSARGSWESVNA